MPSMANQIKNALAKYVFKRPYQLPMEVQHVLFKDRRILEEYFELRPALNAANAFGKNTNFEILGTNMTTALVTGATTGGITLTTAGASGDSAIVLPHLTAGQSNWTSCLWSTDKSITYEATIATGANITAATIWAGFKLTNTDATTDNNQIYFRYQDTVNGGGWQIIHSRAGSLTTTSISAGTLPVVAVSTVYRLVIALNAARQPRVWINNQEILFNGLGSVFPALTTGINLIPYIGLKAGAAAAKAIDVSGLICTRIKP